SGPWYQEPRKSGQLYVTEPYFDRDGSKTMLLSVTKPFYDKDNNLMGVAGADLSMDVIRLIVSYLKLRTGADTAAEPSGEYAYLISRGGKVMAHPTAQLEMSESFA